MESLIQLSCAQLAAAIRERRTTCIAAGHLADREIARGYVRGPLHGVPMAHKDMYYRRGRPAARRSCATRLHDYSAQVRERLERGRPTLALDDVKARQARAAAITAFCEAVFSRVDLVHGPVVSFPAPTITETDISTGETAAQMRGRFVRLTRPISYLGLPVVVANTGLTRAGMPIGMQLIAPPLDEATALRAGHAFQRATDWHLSPPAR